MFGCFNIHIFVLPKIRSTPTCDGRAKVQWTVPIPDGVTRYTWMVHSHARKCDGVSCQNAIL